MKHVKKSVLLWYSPHEMYQLVTAVADYPKFLPWCGGVDVLSRTDDKTAARIHIHYHGIRAHFATENTKEPPHLMKLAFREGPFRCLDGSWHFTKLGDHGCKIEFHLHYEFSNRLLEKALGPVFGHIVGTFVDSFVKRAHQVHG